MRKVSISASIEMDIAAQLAAEAKRRGETLSEVINHALQDYLKRHEQKSRSGRFVTVTEQDQQGA